MSTGTKSIISYLALLIILIAATVTAEDKPADPLDTLKSLSDSTLARAAKAFASQDTALVRALFREDIQLYMPGGKTLEGIEKVMKYAPLLMERFGGSELTHSRTALEMVSDYTDLARETGKYTLTKKVPQAEDRVVKGMYTVYWRLQGETWFIERAFISER